MPFETLQDWLTWQESLHPKEIDLGLERVKRVYEAIKLRGAKPLTITVGGTNGKGSCIAFLESILREEGYRVGAYTSPHLVRYNERIRVNGEPVGDEAICAAFERIERVRNGTSLSFFEFGTLAALDLFDRAGLDVQLLEVGLGGRFDAVNIIDADACIVTSICIDHSDWLGETREAIGQEKAGIFREAMPAIIGDPDPPKSLLRCAESGNVPTFCIGRDFFFEKMPGGWAWHSGAVSLADLPNPALQGDHQFMNASAVVKVLFAVSDRLPVSEASMRKGLQNVTLSGRFQYIPGDVPVLLDVAHNPEAARKLAAYLHQSFSGKCIHAVFAIMRDKDMDGVVNAMKDVVNQWYLSPLAIERSAKEPALLAAFARCAVDRVSSGFEGFADAFGAAGQHAKENDLIVIFGSFFLVSEYLKATG
ncbi:MAG: bifunctional tetrahydrofolate synthase/dihydrofolate synthase [Pseudomonadota bacterium]